MAQGCTAPPMDWENDSLVYQRLRRFKRDVQEKFKGLLFKEKGEVKANILLSWLPNDVKDYLYNIKDEFKDPEEIWTELENKFKLKVNELSSFHRLRFLQQGNMTTEEFLTTARKLVDECAYPNNGERLLRDIIVSGINSKNAYTKCIDKGKDLTYAEAIKIIRNEEEIKRQVSVTRPEFSAQETKENPTAIHHIDQQGGDEALHSESIHKLNYKMRSPKRYGQNYGRNSTACQYCGDQKPHPREQCKASGKSCLKCGKTGHFRRMCRSNTSPRRQQSRDYESQRLESLEKQIKQLTAAVHQQQKISVHKML